MCNYKILYHDKKDGYVIRCAECNNIQIGFGNLGVTFTVPVFRSFYNSIKSMINEQHYGKDPHHKTIRLHTPCEGIYFLLSPHELLELYIILDSAETEMQSQELINLFSHDNQSE
jgi:hypothetical protein